VILLAQKRISGSMSGEIMSRILFEPVSYDPRTFVPLEVG